MVTLSLNRTGVFAKIQEELTRFALFVILFRAFVPPFSIRRGHESGSVIHLLNSGIVRDRWQKKGRKKKETSSARDAGAAGGSGDRLGVHNRREYRPIVVCLAEYFNWTRRPPARVIYRLTMSGRLVINYVVLCYFI